jgi:Cu(I)/Ag(I) efflux system membrane fusion protein
VGTPGLRLEGIGARVAGPVTPAQAAPEPAAGGTHPAEFQIPAGRLQRVGVRTAPAEKKTLQTSVRAVGRVIAEETTLEDVALKVRGWVGEVFVDAVGDPVKRGEALFSVYSPELFAAQAEYVEALRSQERARETSAPDRADYLVRAARNRLRLWDIADRELEHLTKTGEPVEHLPIRAAVSGYVVEKNLVKGSAFQAGQRLYRIAPLSQVWIEAEVYEYELSLVREGQAATVTLPYMPGRSFPATVGYVYPTLDPQTRTARLRLEIPNPDLALRLDMYANVLVHVERGERLVVPQSAVLHAGERSFVFRAVAEGRFRPQPVEIGLRSGEDVEILAGLEPGDIIVTSGTFLIASESRLRAALEQW